MHRAPLGAFDDAQFGHLNLPAGKPNLVVRLPGECPPASTKKLSRKSCDPQLAAALLPTEAAGNRFGRKRGEHTVHTQQPSGAGRRVVGLAAAGLVASAAMVSAAVPVSAATTAATVTTLAAYEVRSSGLSTAQAAALRHAFGLPGVERAADGSVRFSDEKAFLRVPTIDRGLGETDEDGNTTVASALDLAAIGQLTAIGQQVALSRTAAALRASELTPAQGRASAGHSTLDVVNREGAQLASAKLDTTVTYSFSLGGVPYQGPGAKIRVAYDGTGRVTQLAYSTRELVPAGGVPVLDLDRGRDRCATALGGPASVRASYAYHAPKLSHPVNRIEPSLRCEGVSRAGQSMQVIFVAAAVHAQLPTPVPVPVTRQAGPTQLSASTQPTTQASTSASVINVGSEGTGVCSGLDHTGTNLDSFNDEFSSRGIPVEFSWLDGNAWENDWKDAAFGGNDGNWTDAVDMSYWQGHGTPTGFMFDGCSNIDDDFMANTEARWGNQHAEWMSLFTCNILNPSSGGPWWQRWGNAFHGLHQINSFGTVSYHSSDHGTQYAEYLLRNNPKTVKNAWAWASIDDQPNDVKFASMGPVSEDGMVNINDYFWGKGAVGPDVKHSDLTAWWYLTGSS